MSTAAQDWLPLSALGHRSARRAVEAAVEAWSQDWLPRRSLAVAAWTPLAQDRREDGDGEGWRLHGEAVALSVSRRAATRLLGWVLDERLEDLALNDADRRLVGDFEHRLLGDLAGRLEAALGRAGPARRTPASIDEPLGGAGVVVGLAEGAGSPLIALALPGRILRPFIKAALPPPRRAATPPAARSAALAPTEVRLSALLGRAELSLADLRSLAPGDVLVLDRSLADGAALVVAATGASVGHAAVAAADDHITLTLQSSS